MKDATKIVTIMSWDIFMYSYLILDALFWPLLKTAFEEKCPPHSFFLHIGDLLQGSDPPRRAVNYYANEIPNSWSSLPGIEVGSSQPKSKSQEKQENEVSVTVFNYSVSVVLLMFQEETYKSLWV